MFVYLLIIIKYFHKDLCVDMKDLEFGAVVGRGSFAAVHRRTWRGTEVALKRIRMPFGSSTTITNLPKEISILRFVRGETLALSIHFVMYFRNLKHPNIVELIAYAMSEEEIVLVTNFDDGSNLDNILFQKKPLDVS